MVQALAGLGYVTGLILDMCGNSGIGFDHVALMGRFLPVGKTLKFQKRYQSAGERSCGGPVEVLWRSCGGPVVVIVDCSVRSACETLAANFKEDGIGESPTAGMSSSKTIIELPSRLFSVSVSVWSSMARSNAGRGLEGLGVKPHELIAFEPDDLA